jgi:dihydrofolate reductase
MLHTLMLAPQAEPMSTIYFTTASLDGFLADQDGSLDWLFEVPREVDPHEEVAAFFGRVGAFAMGATTYQWMIDNLGVVQDPDEWRSWYETVPAWVFTHRSLPPVPGIPIRFVEGDVREVHREMAETAGSKDVWLVGGGELVGAFDDAGLLDQIEVAIQPVILGGGAQLLPRRIPPSRLELQSVQRLGQSATLTYRVKPRPST